MGCIYWTESCGILAREVRSGSHHPPHPCTARAVPLYTERKAVLETLEVPEDVFWTCVGRWFVDVVLSFVSWTSAHAAHRSDAGQERLQSWLAEAPKLCGRRECGPYSVLEHSGNIGIRTVNTREKDVCEELTIPLCIVRRADEDPALREVEIRMERARREVKTPARR